MRVPVDPAGRLVIPRDFRRALRLSRGGEVEISLRDGRLEIEPVLLSVEVEEKGRFAVFKTKEKLPPLTAEQVRATLQSVREEP